MYDNNSKAESESQTTTSEGLENINSGAVILNDIVKRKILELAKKIKESNDK